MKFEKLANRLLAFVLATFICLSMFLIIPMPKDTDIELMFTMMDTWETDPKYQYYDNGSVINDLGISAYNDYLRELNKTTPLPEVVVAVIDSGINMNYDKFQGRVRTDLATNFNLDAGNSDVWNYDLSGHGTHVSGIILDSTLPNVKVLPIKIFVGDEPNELVSSTLIDNSINYIIDLKKQGKANIVAVNMSLGTSSDSLSYEYATTLRYYQTYIDKLRSVEVLPIVAAGNQGSEKPSLPAACKGTIAVSSYNGSDDLLSSFSNYGNHISLTAPGQKIISAGNIGNELKVLSGTSMSTPFVSACYAMLMSDVSKTTKEELGISWSNVEKYQPYYYMNMQHKALLLAAFDIGPVGNDQYFGYGRVKVSSFAVAPEDIDFKPSKNPDELNSDTTVLPDEPESSGDGNDTQNIFFVGGAVVVVILIIYAVRSKFVGGKKNESTNTDI